MKRSTLALTESSIWLLCLSIYLGVQKERMVSEDLFVVSCDDENKVLSSPPPAKKFTPSQCTPLFFNAFTMRNAGAVIHTHSQHAVMITLLCEKEFVITHQVNKY